MFTIALELFEDSAYIKQCIQHKSKLKKLPKNTLKVKFIRRDIGYHADDFVKARKSVHTIYQVFTFNRNK